MGTEDKFGIKQYIIPLIFTAAGILFGTSYVYAYGLLIVALVLFSYVWFSRKLSRYKYYYSQDDVKKAFLKIYEEATKKGGVLIATQITPKGLIPPKDGALDFLKKTEGQLVYKRFIYLEDKYDENKWIRNMLEGDRTDSKVNTSIYFIKRSFMVHPQLWDILPRANMLLYQRENNYACLVGLERLSIHVDDEKYKQKNTNFAIEVRTKEAHDRLSSYFNSIVANPNVVNVKSVTQYEAASDKGIITNDIQSIITELLLMANNLDFILHIGIFGKIAVELNSFQKIDDWKEHESDVDIVIIVKRESKGKITEKLSEVFTNKENCDIIWGDDTDYFYHFRNPNRISIDLEIHEINSNFYIKHQLLGCSIFANYYSLYSKPGNYLYELLPIPYGYSSEKERSKLFLNDRKGLIEFMERLEQAKSMSIDLRRVVAIVIKNSAWVISGSRPLSTINALNFLAPHWSKIFPSVNMNETRELLSANSEKTKNHYVKNMELCQALVKDGINFFKTLS